MRQSGHSLGAAAGRVGRLAGIWLALAIAAGLVCAPAGLAQNKKKNDDHTRSVQGVVTQDEKPVSGAVVQLKNTKTLQVRSFITQENGSYYFHELSQDVDYELRADFHGASSPTKALSSFDNRKQAILDLKLSKK